MGITYYEDAMFFEEDFESNKCDDYIGLMKEYLKNGKWNKPMKNPPYLDPDTLNKKWRCSYFEERAI